MDPTNNVSCPQFIHALTFLANDFTSSVLSSIYKTSCPILFLSWMKKKKKERERERESEKNLHELLSPNLPTWQHLCSETLPFPDELSKFCQWTVSTLVCHIHSSQNNTLLASFPLLPTSALLSAWLLLSACKLDMLAPVFILFSHLINIICPHVVLSVQPYFSFPFK